MVSLIGPIAPARLQQPETSDVLEQPGGTADAAFVREVQLARARRDHGCVQLGPQERPRPRAQKRPVTVGANRRDRRPRIVAGGRDDPDAVERRVRIGADVPDDRSRFHHLRQNPRRHVEHAQEVGRPRPRPRIDELRRRRIGELGGHVASQPVVHQIGNRPERRRRVDEAGGRAACGVQLIERVEGQELNAGDRVDLVGRNAFEDGLHDAVGALVAIVIRVLEQHALLADERVVAPPGVDADAFDRRGGRPLHPLLDLEPDPQHIPLERAVLSNGLVDEAVDLADVENARAEPPEHSAAALGSEVERQKMSACSHGVHTFGPAPPWSDTQNTLSPRPHKASSGASIVFRKPERASGRRL